MGRARWERANVVGTRDVVARYAARTRPQTWPCTQRLSSLSYDHGYNDYARLVIGRDEKSVANPFVSGNKGVMRGNFSISILCARGFVI